MKKILISFANQKYYKSQQLLEKTAYEIGNVDKVYSYTDVWLKEQEFYNKNKFIFDQPRGCGYWLWKMYILSEIFYNEPNSIICYCDSGVSVLKSLNELFNLTEEKNKLVFKVPGDHPNKKWTKKDAFILTNCDSQEYWNSPQINGAISFWKNTEENILFIKEWLRYCKDARILTDLPNICGQQNSLEFKDHRHDQSILSLLVKKYNIEIFRDPTQWGNSEKDLFPNSGYDQLFLHHRGNI